MASARVTMMAPINADAGISGRCRVRPASGDMRRSEADEGHQAAERDRSRHDDRACQHRDRNEAINVEAERGRHGFAEAQHVQTPGEQQRQRRRSPP